MSSPVPPPGESNAASGAWKASVAQSYRSAEVRKIANDLASLEPGATASSKLMLAMRFEDGIFNQSTSLADYHKRIDKKLKKMKKRYVAPDETSSTTNSQQQERLLQLKRKYGERLQYIVDNGDKAIACLKQKNDTEKARILQQHTNNSKLWATQLGVLKGTTPQVHMEAAAVQKLQENLNARVDNIRLHVVKFSEPDLFLQEQVAALENSMKESTSQKLATATSRRLKRLGWSEFDNPVSVVKESLDKLQQPIAPPSREKESQQRAALLHLDKLRSASQAVLGFLDVPNKTDISRGVLDKTYSAASQSLAFLSQVTPNLVGTDEKTKTHKVTLEDAWTKVLEFPSTTTQHDDDDDDSLVDQQPSKRARIEEFSNPVIRSRVLLTPGRKVPSNLLSELKRKGAKLVRPPPDGHGSHLIVDFGSNAFVMTIYLVPLLVTLRAASKTTPTCKADDCASWIPIESGLKERTELNVWGVTGSTDVLGHAVEQQLRFASAQATHVLRQCFQSTSKAKNDFEVEISEGTALLQFLQLARTTYMPDDAPEAE